MVYMKKFFRSILNGLGVLTASAVGLVWFAILIASFPLSVLAVMNYTDLEWWWAIVATVVGLMLPIIGQIGFVVATIYGGYILFINDFDFGRAAYDKSYYVSETQRKQAIEELTNSETPKEDTFKQIFGASVAYYASATVCGDRNTIEKAEGVVNRVVRWGNSLDMISVKPSNVLQSTSSHVERNKKALRDNQNMTCGEVRYWVSELDKMTKNLR